MINMIMMMIMISDECLVWRWLAEMPRSEYCTGSRYLGIIFNFVWRSWLITDQIFADWHEDWEDSHPAKSTILPPWATWKSCSGVWRELLRRRLVNWTWASGRWSSWALSPWCGIGWSWSRSVIIIMHCKFVTLLPSRHSIPLRLSWSVSRNR